MEKGSTMDSLSFDYLLEDGDFDDSSKDVSLLSQGASTSRMRKIHIPSLEDINKRAAKINFNVLNNRGPLPSKIIQPEVPTTINLDDDDDPDICIVEKMSQPLPKKRCHLDKKPYISGQSSSPSAPTTHDVSNDHKEFEKKDEQSVDYRALQDLHQPTSEATPPDGSLTVPLMKHQRIALSWMVEKETNNRHTII